MRRWKRWLLPAALLVIVVALFAGPLFPWSPLKPGYTHFVMHRADVYYPSGTMLEEAYQHLDTLIDEAEKFHRLKMTDRITVITPSSWSAFRRHAPWEGSNAIGALTLQTGNVIYVTPKLAEKHIDTTEFLRHELSHAIIDQNTTLWRGHKLNAQPWLYEGLAVNFGNQKSYLTRAEFLERARTRPLAPAFNGDNSDMRFNYVAWRYFLDYLISTRGRDRFQEYVLGAMQDPDRARAMFPEYFKISFDDAVREFGTMTAASTI